MMIIHFVAYYTGIGLHLWIIRNNVRKNFTNNVN